MPITLITGPANAGKARAVLEVLREHCARGEQPLLVVPTRADVERYGRELAEGGLLAGARVERFEGLLAEAIRRAGGAQRPLGTLARERVLAAVAARAGQGRATRGVARALAAFVGELQVERVSPARLREALATWAAVDPAQGARAQSLGAQYEDYRRVLAGLGRTDAEQRATGALDALRRTPARWGGLPVLLYGFDDFTRLQLDAVETLGIVVGARVTVSLAFERGRTAFAGRAATFQTLLPLAAEHRELQARAEYYAPGARAALHHLERSLFESEPPVGTPVRVAAGDAVRLLEGGGERAELELVAEQIVELLQQGVAPGEIAVAHRAPGTIGELLGEVFAAHGIRHTRERRVRFADTALGGALLGALAAVCEPEAELGRLLTWLRAPGVLAEPERADELEARARRSGASTVAQGQALWEAAGWPPEPLRRLDRLREAAGAGGGHGGPQSGVGDGGLRAGVGDVSLQGGVGDGSPRAAASELIAHAARELELLAGAWREGDAAELAGPDALEVERRALEVGCATLGELGELAVAAPELAADAAALLATLRGLELVVGEGLSVGAACKAQADASRAEGDMDVGAAEPGRLDAVAVLDPLTLRARRVRVLFLCGLQEGVFPAPARAEPLFSEDERRRLVETSGLLALAGARRAADMLAAERYLLYAAVSRPEELLVLSWHTADDDGVASARSLFVDDVCDLFTCDLHGARSRRALGEVGEGRGTGEAGSAAARAGTHRLAPLRDERVLAELRERRLWSASSLEAWASCPARWFVERLLGAKDLDPQPEPLARGGLAHAALRDVLEGLRVATGSARLRPEVLPRARELLRAALAEREREHPLSVAPERVPGVRRRLQADLERYLEHAAAQASPLEPKYLELSFGFPDEQPGLPALELGEGVQVRGRIDRVDVDPAGTGAVVYDYKSSRALEAGKWSRERSFQVALYMCAVERRTAEGLPAEGAMQGAVEGLPTLHAIGGFYQPLSGRDLRARGVLDEEAGVALDCVRGDMREPAEVETLIEEVLEAARAAAAQARMGALEARPGTCGFGDGACMYPSICRCQQ